MNRQPNDIGLTKFYTLVVGLTFTLTVLCLASAISLAVYADQVQKPSGTVESLVPVLSHCFTMSVGGFAGRLTGPGLAGLSQR